MSKPQSAKKKPDKSKTNEILDLFVDEVSLVDQPANLREFVTIKRKQPSQEDNMSGFEIDPKVDPSTLVDKLEWFDLAKAALPDDLKKTVESAVAWMKKNASAEGAPKDEILAAAALLTKIASGKFPAEPKAKADDDGDDDDKDKKDKDKDKDADKKKSVLSVFDDGTLEIAGESVKKGKLQFTADRTDALKKAIAPLMGVLAQVDAEGAKSLIGDLVKEALPGEVKWTQKNAEGAPDIEGKITKALEPLLEELKNVSKRVETIEGTRSAPQSEPGDGDTTDVKKNNEDDPWAGLPV